MHYRSHRALAPILLLGAVLAGCGGSVPAASHTTQHSVGSGGATQPGGAASTSGTAGSSSGALSADARSAATGDIPDNQVFLTFTDRRAGWSMKYPEGWTQGGSGPKITFSDKNNLVRVVIARSAAPTPASVAAELRSLRARQPTLTLTQPISFPLPADRAAVRARYTTKSAPNPVTGKRVLLIVDRYVLHQGSRVATVDLGTPRGVDNVDAYRMMIQSFRWR